jgi:hypothetical protein
VSALLEDLDEVRSDPAGGSGDGNLLAPVFGLHRSSFPSAGCAFRRFTLTTNGPVQIDRGD